MELSGKAMLDRLGVAPKHHPRRFECDRYISEWLTKFSGFGGLVSQGKYVAWKFGDLASAMYPDSRFEVVLIAAYFTHWIAAVDDLVEESPQRIGELQRAHMSEKPSGSVPSGFAEWGKLVDAWADIESRLIAQAAPAFRGRVGDALTRLFEAYAWESGFRREKRLPTLQEFVEYRHASGGLPLYLLILEQGVGGPFDEDIASAVWFKELNQLVGNLTCFANDLLSFEWDHDNDNPVNLTRVLSGSAGARHEVVWDYFFEQWQRMLALRDGARLRVKRESSLDSYLDALPSLVSGVFSWMEETKRYDVVTTKRA